MPAMYWYNRPRRPVATAACPLAENLAALSLIVYVSTERFSTPARRLRNNLPLRDRHKMRHLSYEELFFERAGPVAHYIFTDFDRLSRFQMECVAAFVAALRRSAPEARVLNDPLAALERTPLLVALHRSGLNDFAVTRLDTGEMPERYPVFVRAEDGYAGPETNLIHDSSELTRTLAELRMRGLPLKGRIAVGFAAEAGQDGLFRKFAALKIGGEIFAYHLHRSKHWVVKRNFPLFDGADSATDDLQHTEEAEAEVLEYVRTNPHARQLERVYDIAGIEFGRVDYGIVAGRLQTYEINTNPNAPKPESANARLAVIRPKIASALESLDTPISVRGRVRFDISRPRVHDLPLPRRKLLTSIARRISDRVRPKRPLSCTAKLSQIDGNKQSY